MHVQQLKPPMKSKSNLQARFQPKKKKQTRSFVPAVETQSSFNKTESLSGGMFSPAQETKLVCSDTLSEFTAQL